MKTSKTINHLALSAITSLALNVSTVATTTLIMPSITFAQTAQGTPDAFVKATAEDLLTAIKADKAIMAGDTQRINALVNDKVLPHINLAKMTQTAVGRAWTTATPEQQITLQKEFRTLLQRTYSGALSLAKDATLKMSPFRGNAEDTDVVIRTLVIVSKGEPVSVDYRLKKIAGAWKVHDLNVAGSWLVQNYKSTFSKEVEARGIEGLIKFLQTKNMSK